MRKAWMLGPIVAGVIAVACGSEPPMTPTNNELGMVMFQEGMDKTPIAGTIAALGSTAPRRVVETPSGRCHFFDLPVFTESTGDIVGTVEFVEQIHRRCDRNSNMVASAPFAGDVTWNGRSGTISGQFTTNCKPDASQPVGVSCDGTYTARGSGGLEGVRFHIKWGPGWYPFSYTGTALSK